MNRYLISFSKLPLLLFPFLLLFLFFQTDANSQEKPDVYNLKQSPLIILNDNTKEQSIGLHMSYIEDTEKKITFEMIRSAEYSPQFIRSTKKVPNFGFTKSAYWLKFEIIYKPLIANNEKQWLIEIGFPILDHIKLYIPKNSGGYRLAETGDKMPFINRDIKHHNFLFKIKTRPFKKSTYYLYVETESSMQIPTVIWSKDSFIENVKDNLFFLGIYYGLMIVMIFYNLFLFFSIKDKAYLYYILYIIGYISFQFSQNGLSFEYLWPDYPFWANRAIPFSIAFSAFWCAFFTRAFLNTKKLTPSLDKAMIFFIITMATIMPLSLILKYAVITKIVIFFSMLQSAISLYTGILCWKRGTRTARFYVIAWSMFFSGMIVIGLVSFGFIPANVVTNSSVQIGSALLVILLSLGLADRINLHRFEKIEAQKKALEAQEEAVLSLKKADRIKEEYAKKLERTVKERTEDLKNKNTTLVELNTVLEITLKELNQSQEQLVQSEKMAALGQLIAGIAHEINTPLGAIKGASDNITGNLTETLTTLPHFFKSLPDELLDSFMEILKISVSNKESISSREARKARKILSASLEEKGIEYAHSHADTLVDMGIYETIEPVMTLLKSGNVSEILEMAYKLSGLEKNNKNIKIAIDRASKIVFALKKFAHQGHSETMVLSDIIDGIETVLTLYNNQMRHGVEVERKYGDIPHIVCSPGELSQVWTNLLHNALQAIEYKGKIEIHTSYHNGNVKVSFIDNGEGIPENILGKIFQPFFTTKALGEGSGLGLDICNRIVKKHNGTIDVESKSGFTAFHVTIPEIIKTEYNIL
jgi:signal transduction histidine kinase